MAQAFVTTYRNHFRGHKEPIRKSKKPLDRHAASAPVGDYWIDTDTGDKKQKKDLNIPYAQALVDQSLRRLMFSTYQMNYCTDKVKASCKEMREAVQRAAGEKGTQIEEQSFENELLQYCRELYSTKTSKILPPTETARRVYGYIRPEAMYTPLTHYQMAYGKAGYDIMSNPMQYLNNYEGKNKSSNSSFCTSKEILKKTSFNRDVKKSERVEEEKAERRRKLEEIMDNLDRCSNHVENYDEILCPCGLQL